MTTHHGLRTLVSLSDDGSDKRLLRINPLRKVRPKCKSEVPTKLFNFEHCGNSLSRSESQGGDEARGKAGAKGLLGTLPRWALAVGFGDHRDDEPQGSGVDGVPEGFLRGGYARRAEDDERARGAGVQELREQDTIRVGVKPGDQDAHGGQGGGEGKEKGEPVVAVGRGGSEVVDDGDVPSSPEQAEQDRRSQSAVPAAHFREREAHPTDFFEKAGDKTERDANQKPIGRKNRRDECFHGEQNGKD